MLCSSRVLGPVAVKLSSRLSVFSGSPRSDELWQPMTCECYPNLVLLHVNRVEQ